MNMENAVEFSVLAAFVRLSFTRALYGKCFLVWYFSVCDERNGICLLCECLKCLVRAFVCATCVRVFMYVCVCWHLIEGALRHFNSTLIH